MDGISALIKGNPESSLTPFSLTVDRERTVIYNPEVGLHQTPNPPELLDLGLSSLHQ